MAPRELKLEGTIIWADANRGSLVLQDDSGAVRLELDRSVSDLAVGRKVLIESTATVAKGALFCRSKPLLGDEGKPDFREKAATVHLTAGRHPLRLEYYQRSGRKTLQLMYEGPDISRQPIPAAALSHQQADGHWEPGLMCKVYKGRWERIPVFGRESPVSSGIANDFDPAMALRDDDFGLVFSGALEVPVDGDYSFRLTADDGCRFFLDEEPVKVSLSGPAGMPEARVIAAGQKWEPADDYHWVEAEGTVATLGHGDGRWYFDLVSDGSSIAVEVVDDGTAQSRRLPLLGSRVKVRGAGYGTQGKGSSAVMAGLLVPGMEQVRVQSVQEGLWTQTPLSQVSELNPEKHPIGTLVRLRGKVVRDVPGSTLRLDDGSGTIGFDPVPSPPSAKTGTIELLGPLDWSGGAPVLPAVAIHSPDGNKQANRTGRLALSSIPQIRALRPDNLPDRVRLRGVVTCDQDNHSVTIQESGSGITCWLASDQSPPLQMGDQIELTGSMIRGAFAPNVMDASAKWLGKGMLPEPARPARDLLLNGSLNARWVEVEGVVSQVQEDLVTVSMAGGPIHVRVLHGDLSSLSGVLGAVVRVRGIVAPVFNDEHQIIETYVRVSSPLYVTVVTPAGADPFAVPLKRVPELREFDPAGASSFNRVRITGQVIHASTSGYYLLDGGHGVRFMPRGPVGIVAGTQVEVSGLPQLGGPSPVLEDAVVRTTGSADLPTPVSVKSGGLFDGSYDATLVRLAATLVEVTSNHGDQLLELQQDHWKFIARLPADRLWQRSVAPGSELELTGVCVARDGRLGAPRTESFELLLNSPADIRILSQPPWWSTRRILGLAGTLSLVLILALVWIVQLRRRVEERTAQLAVEIHQREVAEQRRAIEEERSRIARDLHDDLGAKVTKLTMLAAQAGEGPGGTTPGVRMISETSHELTRAMDEVVWTVNPRNDTLPRLAHFLLHYAENYFQGSGMRLRLKGPGELPEMLVHAGVRHHLLLAVKETLRNVMKHSAASECRMEVGIEDGLLRVRVGDNGKGIDEDAGDSGRNGLVNMKHRMEQLGGSCEWETATGAGTTVTFCLALSRLAPLSS